MDLSLLARLLNPIKQRIALLVGRGLLKAVAQDGRLVAQLLAGEEVEHIRLVQHFGLASRPQAGAELVVLFPGGDRSLGLCVATSDGRYAPTDLPEGAVALYSTGDGLAALEDAPEWVEPPEDGSPVQGLCRLVLRPDRVIELSCAGLAIKVNGAESAISPEGLEGPAFESVAQVGRDVVVIDHGDSAGTYTIQRGAEA